MNLFQLTPMGCCLCCLQKRVISALHIFLNKSIMCFIMSNICISAMWRRGELSILQDEITKMTMCIREQNNALRKEKVHLADSLADIAHQLRTPLISANLILALLEQEQKEAKKKALLCELEELFVQMEWLVNSLLKLSRLDAGVVEFYSEPIAVRRLLQTAIHPLQISMVMHNISLKMDMPDEMQLQGDLSWLSEAIQNILKNCIQSVGDDGMIQMTGMDTLLYSEISICDNGPGFEREDLPRLFERFYYGKDSSTAGFSIGLSRCKIIITRNGGTINVRKHPQGGAVFCIRFPK